MGTVVKYDNIFQYNESRGVETLHPLVSVIDFSKAEPIPPGHYRHCFGFYAVFLKDVKCGDLRYGRNYYDYQEGTLVFMAPGQVVEVKVRKTIDILFEKCYTITRFCENPLKAEDDWIKDYALEEEI